MVIPGETLASGAPRYCKECGMRMVLTVLRSAAGFYLGTECSCGPYSRESGYYRTADDAVDALEAGNFGRA